MYKTVAVWAKYFGVDRPDLQSPVKSAWRGMAAPDEADLGRVKRIARYDQIVPEDLIATGGESEGDIGISTYVRILIGGRLPPQSEEHERRVF